MRTENDMSKILTVAIPSYNVEKFLKTTLDSFLCEESAMEKNEVIVVDDGSKDSTAAIGKEYEATSARSKKLALLRKYNFRHYSLIQFLSKLRNGSK